MAGLIVHKSKMESTVTPVKRLPQQTETAPPSTRSSAMGSTTVTPFQAFLVVSASNGEVVQNPTTATSITSDVLPKDTLVLADKKMVINGVAWIQIQYDGDKTGWMLSQDLTSPPPPIKPSVQLKVPLISQLPELPRGCEVTSLAMLLQSAGVKVDKLTLAHSIKTVSYQLDGVMGNPDEGFVGNMFSSTEQGLGVYHGPVFEVAQTYLGTRAVDMTGEPFDSVLRKLNDGKPVWVIVNSTFITLSKSDFEEWNTANGKVFVTKKEHAVLLTGYDNNHLYVNDPLSLISNRSVAREPFVSAWEQMGEQAISYQ